MSSVCIQYQGLKKTSYILRSLYSVEGYMDNLDLDTFWYKFCSYKYESSIKQRL
jgi:hypothetical protein